VILVCGEALFDAVLHRDGKQQLMPGGGPFNTARALGRFGVPTAFLGHLSTDALGRQLAELLAADGASLALASYGPEPTTLAVAQVDDEAGLAAYEFLVDGTSSPNLTAGMFPRELPSEVTAIHVGTLGLVLEPMASTLTDLIEREGGNRLVMLDPNVRPAVVTDEGEYRDRLGRLVAQSTIVKASVADLGWLNPELGYESAADLMLGAGARLVIVTLGPGGAYAVTSDSRVIVEARQTEVVDTIGAGDAFSAAFLAWLYDHDRLQADLSVSRGELQSALEFACLAASLTCAKAGAEPPTREEIKRAQASA
jgi:fructokinase